MGVHFIDVDTGPATAGLGDLLAADAAVWSMLDLVDRLDLDRFEAAYRSDGSGGRPYDPRLLLTAVLHCYRRGIRSPNEIAAELRDRIDLRLLFGSRVPAPSTVRRFVVRHGPALADVFVQVLAGCARAGLVDVAVTATDSTPVRAAASLTANRSRARLRLRIAETREQLDGLTADAGRAADALPNPHQHPDGHPDGHPGGELGGHPGGELGGELGGAIELICTTIPARAAVLQRRLTRLEHADQIAQHRADARATAADQDDQRRIEAAEGWVTRHTQTLTAMITAQDVRYAAYQNRAAAAHGRRPSGRAALPSSQTVHIHNQRQALTNARQRRTDLRATNRPQPP